MESVRAQDGRVLTYAEYGSPHGSPVFLLHGTPGSRMGPRPRWQVLYWLGIRLIAYDRPGYGGSDRCAERTIADAAGDVAAIADELGLDRFAVVGRSGGAPHALACAALLPERVTKVSALVPFAPRDLMGPDWYQGMVDMNVNEYTAAERGAAVYGRRVADQVSAIRADPGTNMPFEDPALPKSDRAIVGDFGIRVMLSENFAEGLRTSAYGWIDDSIALVRPWGFDPAEITVPCLLWHGTNDIFIPVGHSRWLASRISIAETVLVDGVSHFSAVKALPKILVWLVDGQTAQSDALAGAGSASAG
jgi:pimeloyl-ACP methyl ester carboxylesterase